MNDDGERIIGHALVVEVFGAGVGESDRARRVVDRKEREEEGVVLILATRVYGADGVEWSPLAARKAKALGRLGVGTLPVCMAKTQASLSDDKAMRNRPRGWKLTVRDLQVSPGAGFVVVLAGTMVRMPAMPRKPRAMSIDLLPDGTIVGVE